MLRPGDCHGTRRGPPNSIWKEIWTSRRESRIRRQPDIRRRHFPAWKAGKYIGVVSAPLGTAGFEPDLSVIYCNSAQLRGLLTGLRYKRGEMVTSTLNPGGACVHSTVPALQTGACQVTIPCGGDSKRALARDDELIFSVPANRLEDLMLGLRHLDETGFGYRQSAPDMSFEYPQPENYMKVARMIGMDVHK